MNGPPLRGSRPVKLGGFEHGPGAVATTAPRSSEPTTRLDEEAPMETEDTRPSSRAQLSAKNPPAGHA